MVSNTEIFWLDKIMHWKLWVVFSKRSLTFFSSKIWHNERIPCQKSGRRQKHTTTGASIQAVLRLFSFLLKLQTKILPWIQNHGSSVMPLPCENSALEFGRPVSPRWEKTVTKGSGNTLAVELDLVVHAWRRRQLQTFTGNFFFQNCLIIQQCPVPRKLSCPWSLFQIHGIK